MDRRGVKGRRQNPTLVRGSAAQAMVKAARANFRAQQVAAGFAPARAATYARTMQPNEKKNIDTSPTVPTVGSAAAAVTCINVSTAGALPTNRVGRRIKLHSVLIRGRFQTAPTTTGNCPIRLLIIYDKQTNKAAPTASDFFTSDDVTAVNNLGNSHRFKILRDILIPSVGTAGPQSAQIAEYVKINGLETEYIDGAGAGTVADITSGGLFCVIYANNSTATAALASSVTSRVRFSDS